MSEIVLPCPFCRSQPDDRDVVVSVASNYIGISCPICEARGPMCKTKEKAIKDWNTLYDRAESLKELQSEAQEMGMYGLTTKQQERREFVKKCLVEKFSYNNSDYHVDTVNCALGAFEEYDKQLTELEQKEVAE